MWPHDLKLALARRHLEVLKGQIDRWVECGYTIRVEPDPRPFETDYEVKAYITEQIGEDPFSLLIGDFLQNARAALDYIAYALGEAGAGGAMPEEVAVGTGFPIIGDVDREGYSGRGPDLLPLLPSGNSPRSPSKHGQSSRACSPTTWVERPGGGSRYGCSTNSLGSIGTASFTSRSCEPARCGPIPPSGATCGYGGTSTRPTGRKSSRTNPRRATHRAARF